VTQELQRLKNGFAAASRPAALCAVIGWLVELVLKALPMVDGRAVNAWAATVLLAVPAASVCGWLRRLRVKHPPDVLGATPIFNVQLATGTLALVVLLGWSLALPA
jgi:hypothetical protein